MSGIVLVKIGIGCIVAAVVLWITSLVYRKTEGKKIREVLHKGVQYLKVGRMQTFFRNTEKNDTGGSIAYEE